MTTKFLLLGLLLLPLTAISAESIAFPDPSDEDTCPVCGMFVAKYPEWISTVLYKDGHAHQFDGAKDLFKYLADLNRWAPGHKKADIRAIGVTEYYGLARIDAHKAWYVIGSDVLGPMGHELIPLATEADAKEFLQDHAGKRILRFDGITTNLPNKLDQGQFD